MHLAKHTQHRMSTPPVPRRHRRRGKYRLFATVGVGDRVYNPPPSYSASQRMQLRRVYAGDHKAPEGSVTRAGERLRKNAEENRTKRTFSATLCMKTCMMKLVGPIDTLVPERRVASCFICHVSCVMCRIVVGMVRCSTHPNQLIPTTVPRM